MRSDAPGREPLDAGGSRPGHTAARRNENGQWPFVELHESGRVFSRTLAEGLEMQVIPNTWCLASKDLNLKRGGQRNWISGAWIVSNPAGCLG